MWWLIPALAAGSFAGGFLGAAWQDARRWYRARKATR